MYCVYQNQAAAAYSFLYSPFFFLFSFQAWKFFVTLSSGMWGLEAWNLLHTWKMDGWIVYTGIMLLLLFVPLNYFFIFLSNFQTLKMFVTLFSGTVRPRRLKLGTHMDSGQMYGLYWSHAVALIHPFIFSFFFLSNFQTNVSLHFSLKLWGLEGSNLVHTWTVSRCIVCTGIRLLLLIHPLISSFFFLSIFPHTFFRNCEA